MVLDTAQMQSRLREVGFTDDQAGEIVSIVNRRTGYQSRFESVAL